jgi:hypothetical protein
MSFILFMDESGHDHKQMPYEVRGGIALHASRVWAFALQMRELELRTFGVHLHDYGSEVKGDKLLDKSRFKWAAQLQPGTDLPYEFTPETRRLLAMEFLIRGQDNGARTRRGEPALPPSRLQMTAYGQSCIAFAEATMRLLVEQNARLFAAAIPRGVGKWAPGHNPDHLRRDLVYLFERYCYFLDEEDETGLLVMDQVETTNDRRFGQRIARYFVGTETGRRRAERLVPVPLFVTQDVSYTLGAADMCIYAINHGFRLPKRGMDAAVRPEIASAFGRRLGELQWRGHVVRLATEYDSYGIVYVPEPYSASAPDE